MAICLIDLSLPLAMGELRSMYFSPNLLHNDPVFGWVLAPGGEGAYERGDFRNYMVLNSDGFHDVEVPEFKTKPRIVACGGSFTVGMELPVEGTWPRLLQKLLHEEYRVINRAQPGKHFSFFTKLLDDQFFASLQPDYIIFGFSPDRLQPDVSFHAADRGFVRGGTYRGFSYLYTPGGEADIRAAIDGLSSWSYFPLSLYGSMPAFRWSSICDLMMRYQTQRYKSDHPDNARFLKGGNWLRNTIEDRKMYSYQNLSENVDKIRDACERHNVPVFFFFIPHRGARVSSIDIRKERIARYFSKSDKVILLDGDFIQDRQRRNIRLFWENDGHPNGEGHRLIAKLIYRYTKQALQGDAQ